MHVPTMLVMVIVACSSLAIAIGWVARDNEDGLRTWAAALAVQTSAYVLLALRGIVTDWVSIVVGNGLLSLSYSLFILAVDNFHGRKTPLPLYVLPPLVVCLSFPMLPNDIVARVVIGNSVLFLQSLLFIHVMRKSAQDVAPRGRGLVLFGLLIVAAMTAARAVIAAAHPESVATFFRISPLQTGTYLVAFAALILISNGFLMMTKERSDARLRVMALRDRLTGCWNRVRIEEIAEQEMARLRRYGHPSSIIVIDLDEFKTVNDEHGHAAGDAVLREFAAIAAGAIRSTDILGRWGGEEFIIVLPMTSFPEAIALAERIRKDVEAHEFPNRLRITISLGVAACLSTDAWGNWFARADQALYRAKAAGRNRTRAEGIIVSNLDAESESGWVFQLVWRDSYLCGEATIDREHQDLLASANALLAFGTAPANKAEVKHRVREFLTQTARHFTDEERVMAADGYDELAAHVQIHRDLMDRARHLLEMYDADAIGASAIFHFILYELFSQHILVDDAGFRLALKQRRAEVAVANVLGGVRFD